MAKTGSDIEEVLKPFYQRASEAEDRLSRIEAALTSTRDDTNEELLETITELQSKLQVANEELASEQKKAQRLAAENAKLQYRVLHLVQAVREADAKAK